VLLNGSRIWTPELNEERGKMEEVPRVFDGKRAKARDYKSRACPRAALQAD
jgi:hypothetical protein